MKLKSLLKNLIYRCLYFFPAGSNQAVILMYHSIGENNVYFTVRAEEFSKQMDYLVKNNYNVVTLNNLIKLLKTGTIPSKTVVLTFDDGYKDNYVNVYPILKKYNFSATIFLATGLIGQKIPNSSGEALAALSWKEIKEMNQGGLIDFQPHTVQHQKNYLNNETNIASEVSNSKREIEEGLLKTCQLFAYPSGKYNDSIIKVLKNLGFIAALTVSRGVVKSYDDLFRLKRNSIDSRISLNMFKTIIKRGRIN
ncbi:MAG: polysaccharide deacetylase family protein [Patescibacteria group bacterium]|jgi:peptidoglycan/xylan/chitin deacetylase (PgdA/CDA1 family)